MALGKVPGDGKVSPLGNGGGSSEFGGSMAGNDFVANPRGSNTGTSPRDFVDAHRSSTQATDQNQDINAADRAPGPDTAAEASNKTEDAGNPTGAGSIGAAAKPYVLDGGGG